MNNKISSLRYPWKRPEGPVNVWKIIEGTQKLQDGTTESIKFSIQEVPNDRRQEAIEHMFEYFTHDEPICKCMNVVNSPKMIHDFHLLWSYCLDQGIVEAAYVLDENGKITELASINMLCVMSDEVQKDLQILEKNYQSYEFKKILEIMSEMSKKADPRQIYGVDKYIAAFGLSVAPHFRGQKLGLRMIEARTEIGKKHKIPASSTVFTARASQILAERANFEDKLTQNYEDVLDNGKPFFTNIEAKCMKIMMKRLY